MRLGLHLQNFKIGKQLTFCGSTFASKPYAQSEPDITSAVAARKTKRGIAANGLTQKNALRAQLRLLPQSFTHRVGNGQQRRSRDEALL